jgi:hypothetical protein
MIVVCMYCEQCRVYCEVTEAMVVFFLHYSAELKLLTIGGCRSALTQIYSRGLCEITAG